MKHKIITGILWLAAMGWMGFCLFLSWQPGEDTVRFSTGIVRFLLDLLGHIGLTPDPEKFHMALRLTAHFGVFFLAGLLFDAALGTTLPPTARGNNVTFFVTAPVYSACAVLAEVVKIKIPGRHLQWNEAMLNVAGVLCGAGVMWIFFAVIRRPRKAAGRHMKTE